MEVSGHVSHYNFYLGPTGSTIVRRFRSMNASNDDTVVPGGEIFVEIDDTVGGSYYEILAYKSTTANQIAIFKDGDHERELPLRREFSSDDCLG